MIETTDLRPTCAVSKRCGSVVIFDKGKIAKAIAAAGQETGEFTIDIANTLADDVAAVLIDSNNQCTSGIVLKIEDIQDTVEDVLLRSPYRETAKAYILYRDRHTKAREAASRSVVELMDEYLSQTDWRVSENANMAYSLQGLNNHISGEVSKTYWLDNVYPSDVKEAHTSGAMHIHDLGQLSVYCVGWDLQDLLTQGFKGVAGKTESKPARHFRTALGQIVNFFYTLQGEAAGAQAFSSFDTLLAPYVRYDNLDYAGVKQAIQEFAFNVNVPTRVGFQCLSEDTEILTPGGWRGYRDIHIGDVIKTFNTGTGNIEDQEVRNVFARNYVGTMFNPKGVNQDQLISPGHRMVYRRMGIDGHSIWAIDTVEKIKEMGVSIMIPTTGDNTRADVDISYDDLDAIAEALFSGDIEYADGNTRIPNICMNMSKSQAVFFIHRFPSPWSTDSKSIADGLQQIAVDAGFSTTIVESGGKYMLRFIERTECIDSIDTIEYDGIIWCPNTENETVIARRNGVVFITGNTPFTNITMDMEPPASLANQPVIVGGERKPETYGEFANEMQMINNAFLDVMTEGDAKGRVFTFPIPTYNITKDFDWERPGLEKLWEATAKYGIPYFANFVNSDMDPDDARSMCCRLRIDTRELVRRGGGLFGSNPLTGSVGVVTINMGRLGYLASNTQDFLDRLDGIMGVAKKSLEIKRKALERLTDAGLYPYTKFYLRSVKQRFNQYWKNHFSTIGLVGMNEACENLLDCGIATADGKEFALRVMDFMRDRLAEYQKETGNMYNLEATPAEGTSYRLASIDTKRYNDIITAGTSDAPFYTNSTQLPVDYDRDVITTLQLQDELQTKYTGGTVVHVFAGEAASDPNAVKEFVKATCATFELPYFSFTPTFSVCAEHGYISGEHSTCPKCGQCTEIYSRVVGYIRPVSQWNTGKQNEFEVRKLHDISELQKVN